MKLISLKYFISSLLLFVATSVFAVIETYEFDNDAQRQSYEHFIEVLRCPKCQNQNLAGSNSPIAEDLRHELVRLLKEGKQEQEIIDFMVARYGDYVLYDPQFKKNTYALWLAPLFLFLIGVAVVFFVGRRAEKTTVKTEPAENPLITADLSPSRHTGTQDGERRIAWIAFVLAFVFICVGSGLVYWRLGATEQLKISAVSDRFYVEIKNAAAEQREPDLASGYELVTLLLPYLEKHSDDLNLVYMLGSVYAQLSEFDKALPWYKQYLMAVPTDERVLTEYVQLLYITADRQLSERLLFVVDRALTLNPHNMDVLSLMAMHYHQTGQYAQAAGYWQRMLAVMPPDSEAYPAVQQALAEARQRSKK